MKKRDFLKACSLTIGAMLIPRKILALEYYPTTKNPEWAVLYGTWCGSSRDAGVWISEGMNGIADVFDVRENPDLSRYRYIIVGGSIRAGETTKELQEYLSRHKEPLKSKIKGFYIVCGNMMKPVTQDLYDKFIENHLNKLSGVSDIPAKIFLGRITFGLMEPKVREQMQSFPGMKEYDNLNRSECMEFGQKILQAKS